MNNIKLLRVKNGLKQEELGKAVNVTQTAVSQWEKGRKSPDKETAIALADFFGVSLDFLLGRTTERTNSYYANNINESNFVQGSGSVMVGEILSDDESELIHIFRDIGSRGRLKLLGLAFELEDEKLSEKEGSNDKH